jgi:hypothetical protein
MFARCRAANSSQRALNHPRLPVPSQPQALGLEFSNLPRPPHHRAFATNSNSLCAVAPTAAAHVLAVRRIFNSRGRNLILSRSSPFTPTIRSSPSRSSLLYNPQHRSFSSTPFAMTATKIDGTAIAKSIREKLHAEIEATQKVNPRFKPSLKIIQGIFCQIKTSVHMLTFNHSGRPIGFEFVFQLSPISLGPRLTKFSSYLCSHEVEGCRRGQSAFLSQFTRV